MEDNKKIVSEENENKGLTIEEANTEENKEKINEAEENYLKERLYDKIAIPIKVLDLIIVIAVVILVIMLIYFVARKYS